MTLRKKKSLKKVFTKREELPVIGTFTLDNELYDLLRQHGVPVRTPSKDGIASLDGQDIARVFRKFDSAEAGLVSFRERDITHKERITKLEHEVHAQGMRYQGALEVLRALGRVAPAPTEVIELEVQPAGTISSLKLGEVRDDSLRIVATVNGFSGSVFVQKYFWEAMGEKTGWAR